jgi:hypothetical protein
MLILAPHGENYPSLIHNISPDDNFSLRVIHPTTSITPSFACGFFFVSTPLTRCAKPTGMLDAGTLYKLCAWGGVDAL